MGLFNMFFTNKANKVSREELAEILTKKIAEMHQTEAQASAQDPVRNPSQNTAQDPAQKPAQRPVRKGPDYVAMMIREKEYALTLCERLEKKYGKAEFAAPLTEAEISQWEKQNQLMLPVDLAEWLKFSGSSRFKGIPMEFYPITQFKKVQDYVLIGKRENMDIGFVVQNGEYYYIDIEEGKRRKLGGLETIIRFWGYDIRELFAEEELEKLRPVIEEEKEKLKGAKLRAEISGEVAEAMEVFFTKNNIGYLYKWRSFPKCPIRKDKTDCSLIISEPDREGYYQWKPQKQTAPVDFSVIESKLGFPLHKDIKALVSSYHYFMLEGGMGEKSFNIYPLVPDTDVERLVIDRFEKESYAGGYEYILNGHFFHLGGADIDGDDSFALEINNDNGEVLAVEYMDKKHQIFADSLYDLFMNSRPIWFKDEYI